MLMSQPEDDGYGRTVLGIFSPEATPQAGDRSRAELASLGGRNSLEPFPRFVQLLEAPALDAGGGRRLNLADGELAKIGVRPFTGGETQAAFHVPRKPLVDNPESVFRRDGNQSCVVPKNFVSAVLADEREQALMDVPELDPGW